MDRAERLIRDVVDARGSFDVEAQLQKVSAVMESAVRGDLAPLTCEDVRTIIRRKIWRTISNDASAYEISFCLALARRHNWQGYVRTLEEKLISEEAAQERAEQEFEAKTLALEALRTAGVGNGSDVWYDTGQEILKTRVVAWPTESWIHTVKLRMPEPPKRVHFGDPRRIYLNLPEGVKPGKYCRYCRQCGEPCAYHRG